MGVFLLVHKQGWKGRRLWETLWLREGHESPLSLLRESERDPF